MTDQDPDIAADADVEDEDGEGEAEGDDEPDERTPFLKGRGRKASVTLETQKVRALSIDPLAPSSAFDETLRDRLREDAERKGGLGNGNGIVANGNGVGEEGIPEEEDEDEAEAETAERGRRQSERLLERHWKAPEGKKIAVPVRIEPKVYFATERTFLVSSRSQPSWIFSYCSYLISQLFLHRNGSISPFTLPPSPRPFSTSSPQTTQPASSAQAYSPSQHWPPSHTLPLFSCIELGISGIEERKGCIMINTVLPFFR